MKLDHADTTSTLNRIVRNKPYLILFDRLNSNMVGFDLETSTWSLRIPERSRSFLHASLAASQDKLFVIGGVNRNGEYSGTIHQLDWSSMRWTEMPVKLATPRSSAASVVRNDKELIILGGVDGSTELKSVEIFDLDFQTWGQLPSLPHFLRDCSATIHDNCLIVIGWTISNSMSPTCIFDFNEHAWKQVPELGLQRLRCGVVGYKHKVYVLGGFQEYDSAVSVMLDVVAKKKVELTPLAGSARGCSAVVYDSRIFVCCQSVTYAWDLETDLWTELPWSGLRLQMFWPACVIAMVARDDASVQHF
jgi:hypothetical protein